MKIIVLGSKGMLGQMVYSYFQNEYEVIEINTRYSLENRYDFLNSIKQAGEGYIVNCIGRIKQKTDDLNSLVSINSVLPIDIYNNLDKNQFLIQPSTDCVFSGQTNTWYKVTDQPDATDDYGWSKRLSEVGLQGNKNVCVIRVSIIGPDFISDTPKGLLGWFLNNPSGSTLKGYTNHFWNGITTLEWCKWVDKNVINQNTLPLNGLIHLGTSEIWDKYQLLMLFNKVYETNFIITPYATENSIYRCLQPDVACKSLEEQMYELRSWNKEGK